MYIGFPANENFRKKMRYFEKISFREISRFFAKMNIAKGSENDVEFREEKKICAISQKIANFFFDRCMYMEIVRVRYRQIEG